MNNRFLRLINIFYRDGFKGLANHLFYKLHINFKFKNDLERKIQYFSKKISKEVGNNIITGPFKISN